MESGGEENTQSNSSRAWAIGLGVVAVLFLILFIVFVALYSQTKSRPASCPICTIQTCQTLGCTSSSPCPSCLSGTTAALGSSGSPATSGTTGTTGTSGTTGTTGTSGTTGTTGTTGSSTIPVSVTLNTFDSSGCPNQTYIPIGTYLSDCNGVQYDPSSNTLYASCRNPTSGVWSGQYLNLSTCAAGSDITTGTTGVLSCANSVSQASGSYWLPSCTTSSPNYATINVVPGGSWFEANCSNFNISGNNVTATCNNTDISQSLLNGSNCTWNGTATLSCAPVIPSQTITSPIPL